MIRRVIYILAICLIWPTGIALGDNLVVNGSFEMTDGNPFSDNGFIYYYTFPGWTFSGYFDKNTLIVPGSWSSLLPVAGNYQAVFGSIGLPAAISQTLPTSSSNVYDLSFWLANDDGPDNALTVTLGGNTILTLSNQQPFLWKFYEFNGLSVGDAAILEFSAYNTPGYFHIDAISFEEVPEPVSFCLFSTGVIIISGMNWRRGSVRASMPGLN